MRLEQNLPVEQSKSVDLASVIDTLKQVARSAVVLFKLRVVSLLLLSAYGGGMLGMLATGQGSLWAWVVLTLSGGLSAAGASGINQYLEIEQDKMMRRTAKRPLPIGEIEHPGIVLWLSMGMILVAIGLALTVNVETAVWIALGAIIYVGVYTIWLKPRTTLNIVIGGAAGSCAVLSGGAVMGAWSDTAVLLLSALIFVWTPVHFWALALAYRKDYQQAKYPMLPAKVAPAVSARWTALHTVATALCGLAIGFVPQIDWGYLIPVSAISAILLWMTGKLLKTPNEPTAMKLFHASNIYLTVVLVVILLAPIWR